MAVNEAVRDLLAGAKPGAALDGLYAQAQRQGLKLGRNTIAKARRGDLVNPTDATLSALAELFGVDVRDLRAAVGRQRGELGPYVPTGRSASLTHAQRAALDQLIVAIVEEGGTQDAGQAEAKKSDGVIPFPTRQHIADAAADAEDDASNEDPGI